MLAVTIAEEEPVLLLVSKETAGLSGLEFGFWVVGIGDGVLLSSNKGVEPAAPVLWTLVEN